MSKASGILFSDSSKNIKYLGLPVFFKTPELGYAGGLSGTASFRTTFYNDTLTRPSLIQVLGFFTSRQVNAQAISAYIFFPKENNILLFQTSHQYFPDKFWGLGANTQPNDLSNYLFEIFNINPHFKHKVAKYIYVGLLADYQHIFKINYQPGSSFDSSIFVGKKPYEVSALGMSLTYDTRSNNFWPLKGIFISSQILHYEKKYISDFTFTKSITDIRIFQRIFRNQIFALQFYSFQTFGNTPIRDLAALGGPNNLRGIYLGRFRALKAMTFISEYRFKIYKQFNAVLFGGVGQIYNSSKDFNLSASKFSFGGGLRFAFVKKEGLNLRLDYGYSSKTDKGFYFTIGECF
jgi:outer membrane protein assembly factor BamA